MAGRGRFGPSFWEDNAIVTGESRGILWRTVLEKEAAGYDQALTKEELRDLMMYLLRDRKEP